MRMTRDDWDADVASDTTSQARNKKGTLQGVKARLSSLRAGAAVLAASVGLMALSAVPGYAATGNLYATGVNTVSGAVWMGNHLWVSDHFQGFCRLDPGAGGIAVINPSTCSVAASSPGQPAYDPATNFVYIPDNGAKSLGVVRLMFDPMTETVGSSVVMAPGKGLGGNRATAAALGPDGQLYVGFIKSGNIDRVTSPAGDPATQKVQVIGGTTDGRGVTGFAFIKGDLYIAEGAAVSRIANVANCVSGCKPVRTSISAPGTLGAEGGVTPSAIASDGADLIYVADTPISASSVLRYRVSSGTTEVYATSGVYPDGKAQSFDSVGSLAVDGTGNLFVSDGPADAPNGRMWMIPAGSAPVVSGGNGAAPFTSINGSLYASGITAPAGEVWMGSHLWVSDSARGFCRIDALADGTFAINGATCSTTAVLPGQVAYDPATNFVYVPDSDLLGQGVWRLTFDPVSETVANPVLMAPGKGLKGIEPAAAAIGPDRQLYVSSITSPDIRRVTNPAGAVASQVVQVIGGGFFGHGVEKMTFAGNDLYLAEELGVTRIANAVGCASGCKAATFGVNAAAPTAIAARGADTLYIANGSIVLRYTISAKAQVTYSDQVMTAGGTATYGNISALSVDPVGNLFVGDDPGKGKPAGLGHLWRVAPPAP